eukprot:354698-Ditylum_brightwellii.AAC.1
MVLKDSRVKKRPITVRNHQANSTIERIHHTIGNMISEICNKCNSTHNQASYPMQLVFGRDAILNVEHEADWSYIKQGKEDLIRKKNEQENKKRKTHNYQIGDKVLLKGNRATKYGINAYNELYPIEQINYNGTV